jgi:hypothetical protein
MKRQIEIDLPDGYELDINVDRHKLAGYDSVLVVYGLTDDVGEVHISSSAFVVRPPLPVTE